ncbi:MAG TPA: hypothetical protein VGS21_00915, partial [Acidimicrobiales bacterium]|nr:hypothetical protein [Acidimicrobiales bacterium]
SAAAHPARAPLPSTPPADPEGFRDWVLMAEFAVYPVPAPVIQEEDEDDYEFDYSSLDEPGASEPPGHIAAAATHPPAAEVHVQSPPPIVDPGYVTPVGPTADVEDRVEAYEPPAHEQTPFQQPAYEQPAYEQPAYEPAPTFEAAAQHPDTEGPGGYAPEPGYGDVLEHETVGDVQQTDVEEALVAQLTDPVSALDPDPSIVGDTYGEDSSQWVEGSPNGGGQPEAGDAGEYAYGEEGYDEPTEPSGEDEPAPVFVEDVFFGRKAKRGR